MYSPFRSDLQTWYSVLLRTNTSTSRRLHILLQADGAEGLNSILDLTVNLYLFLEPVHLNLVVGRPCVSSGLACVPGWYASSSAPAVVSAGLTCVVRSASTLRYRIYYESCSLRLRDRGNHAVSEVKGKPFGTV
jgi:hypothetical protein